jgi:hypothetical protein
MLYQFPTPDTVQTNAIILHCQAASTRPRGRRLAGRGGSDAGIFTIGVRPKSITRCDRAVTYGIDQGADAATSASAHCIGPAAFGR